VIATVLALSLLLQDPRGAVSGQLRTIDGVPAVNVRVVMIPAPTGSNTVDDGLNYFEPYFELPPDHTLTDNDGNFRLQEIVPGRYFLLAGAAGKGQGTYYPDSAAMKGAEVITVRAGIEVDHLDFQLRVRLGGKVSGKVKASCPHSDHEPPRLRAASWKIYWKFPLPPTELLRSAIFLLASIS